MATIAGYEVVWTDGLGHEQRTLVLDRERAEMFAARYGGLWYPLVRAT